MSWWNRITSSTNGLAFVQKEKENKKGRAWSGSPCP